MYEWDKDAYPMYFGSNLPAFKDFPTTSQGDPSTTNLLRSTFSTLYQNGAPKFENMLDFDQRAILQKAAADLRKFVASELLPV
jgi:hypothetical protein